MDGQMARWIDRQTDIEASVHYGPVFPSLTFGSELMCPRAEAIVISLNRHAVLDQYAASQRLALFYFPA